jgi:hypothetical protein
MRVGDESTRFPSFSAQGIASAIGDHYAGVVAASNAEPSAGRVLKRHGD